VGLAATAIVAIAANLPEIYVGPGADFEDLAFTLSQQRGGMIIAAPRVFGEMSMGEVLVGVRRPLEVAVTSLYGSGLLPDIFSDGGFLAVFDVVWVGMLFAGGLLFASAAVAFLVTMWRVALHAPAAEGEGCGKFALAMGILSFSSQAFLSRYALYFSCVFVARAICATTERR
jgi:hypothetical protein